MAVNTLTQMPSSPNCGTKANSNSRMPMPSNSAARPTTVFSTSFACA